MYRSILDRLSTDTLIHCRPRVDRCFGRASTGVGRRIDRDHIGRLSVNYRRDIGQLSANTSTDTMVPIDVSADIMGHNNSKTPNKISILLSYKYYRPMYREIYRPMSRPIYRTMSRPIYRPIYSVKYRHTIGEASLKYRWTPTLSTDRCVGRYVGRYSTDISTEHRPLHGRYLVECRSKYRSIYRPIHRSRPPIGHMIQDGQVTKLDQDAKKSFCVLRFEINGTSAAEDLENFAMFSVHRLFYTSAPWSWVETCQTAPSKSESGFQRI